MRIHIRYINIDIHIELINGHYFVSIRTDWATNAFVSRNTEFDKKLRSRRLEE